MSAPFVLAVPSKGRLQENTEAFFARAGLKLSKAGGARDYRGTIAGLDNVEVAYLSASEIAAQLSRGLAHLGVTGEDLVRETIADADKRVSLIEGLGFGYAGNPVLIVVLGFAYTVVSNLFSNGFHVYSGELYPTTLRATGAGSAYSLSRLATAVMPFVLVPLLNSAGPTAVFAAIAIAMVIVAVDVAVLGPRTTGRSLAELT